MASGARRITVEFLGKDVSAGKTANQVEGKYSKLGSRMNKVGAAAGKVLAGGLLLGTAAAVKAGQAAADDEAAQSKLAQTLRKAAGASDGQIKSTEAWITAQGKALGVADDELRPALGKLATATHDVSKAQDYAALAMDVSAGSGKSLDTVTTALQKGLNGSVGGLSRLGVATKDADGKTKSLHQITKDLAATYGGAAAKAADTTAGKQKKLQVQFGELQEQIGAKLLPVFAKLADAGLKMVDWMSKNGTLVKVLAGVIGGLVGTLYLVSKAMAAVNLVMSLNPAGMLILAITAIIVVLVLMYKKSETFRNIVNGAFKAVGAAGKFMWEGVLKPVFRFIIKSWLNVAGWIVNGAAKAFGWVPKLGDKLKTAAKNFNNFKEDVNRQLDGVRDKKIKITAPNAGHVINQMTALNNLLNVLSNRKPTKVNVVTPGMYNPGKNARGTSNWRGGPTWVGEKGPEIIDAPRGSRIIPNRQSVAMAGGGGDLTVTAPLVLQLDSDTVWKGLLTLKRRRGGVTLGLA